MIRKGPVAHHPGGDNEVAHSSAIGGGRLAKIILAEELGGGSAFLAYGLRRLGHSIWIADTASRALELAQRHAADLLVTNVALADGSGLTLLRRLRQSRAVIGVALAPSTVDVPFVLEAGFDAVLLRPLRVEDACERIAGLLASPPASSRPRAKIVSRPRLPPPPEVVASGTWRAPCNLTAHGDQSGGVRKCKGSIESDEEKAVSQSVG